VVAIDRFSGGAFGALEDGGIAAFGKLDQKLVGGAFLLVVAREPGAQPSCHHTNNRIGPGIEGGILFENLDTDYIFFELVSAARQTLDNDEVEKPFEPVYLFEGLATGDPSQLLLNSFFGFSAFGQLSTPGCHNSS